MLSASGLQQEKQEVLDPELQGLVDYIWREGDIGLANVSVFGIEYSILYVHTGTRNVMHASKSGLRERIVSKDATVLY